ncbi:hypothetical protein AD428_03750 [Achromobacter sp. DMS1]|nr:hypothetical protein AD428_03750 [Achromobacter sp. DMS1]
MQTLSLRAAQPSESRITEIFRVRALASATDRAMTPIPTLASTSRQTLSKFPTSARNLNGLPTLAAVCTRKEWIALHSDSPT